MQNYILARHTLLTFWSDSLDPSTVPVDVPDGAQAQGSLAHDLPLPLVVQPEQFQHPVFDAEWDVAQLLVDDVTDGDLDGLESSARHGVGRLLEEGGPVHEKLHQLPAQGVRSRQVVLARTFSHLQDHVEQRREILTNLKEKGPKCTELNSSKLFFELSSPGNRVPHRVKTTAEKVEIERHQINALLIEPVQNGLVGPDVLPVVLFCHDANQVPDDGQGVELIQRLPLGHGVRIQVLVGDDSSQAEGFQLIATTLQTIRRRRPSRS